MRIDGWEVSIATVSIASGGGSIAFWGNDRWPATAMEVEYAPNGAVVRISRPRESPYTDPAAWAVDGLNLDFMATPDFQLVVRVGRDVVAKSLQNLEPIVGDHVHASAAGMLAREADVLDLAHLAERYVTLCEELPRGADGRLVSPIDILADEYERSRRTIQARLAEAERRGLIARPGNRRKGGVLLPLAMHLLGTDSEADHE